MEKTKIDWCDSTWNPITGCLHGYEYCYARGIANRFGWFDLERDNVKPLNPDDYLQGIELQNKHSNHYPAKFTPTLHRYKLNEYQNKKGRNIFVCSMADLFGDWVPDEWIEEVFKACEKAPQHNYLFLTKNPNRYNKLLMDNKLKTGGNMWYGFSITNSASDFKFLLVSEDMKTFVSIEPLLEDIKPRELDVFRWIDWVIIGAETGRRKNKVIPKRKWIEDIVNECRENNIPVFMKSSLADIWGEPLIQEFPKELQKER